MKTYLLGLSLTFLAFPIAAPAEQSPATLRKAVQDFNAAAAKRTNGNPHRELTTKAVIAAIRWSLRPSSELDLSAATRAALQQVAVTGELPDIFAIDSLSTYENRTTVFTVSSIRLTVPSGTLNNGSTCSILIEERLIDSRIMGSKELALVQERERQMLAGKWGSFSNQSFLKAREEAIKADQQE